MTLSRLVADAHAAIQFLDSYLGGRGGYTAVDVRAGERRLDFLCRRIDLASQKAPTGAAAAVASAAGACLRRLREKQGHPA